MARLALGGVKFQMLRGDPSTLWEAICPCPPAPAWHERTTSSTLLTLLNKMVGLAEVLEGEAITLEQP